MSGAGRAAASILIAAAAAGLGAQPTANLDALREHPALVDGVAPFHRTGWCR